MTQRESKILWLKDMLEHLSRTQQQLEWTEDPATVRVLTESMLGDLDCCRRLCEDIQRKARPRQAV
jgi:hypothetical protein